MTTSEALKILKEEGIFWSRLGFCVDPPRFAEDGTSILHEDAERYFKYHRDMTKAGIKVHTCILASGWKGVGEYDFTTSMSILKRIMEENPDTYFMPRIKFNPPAAWQKENPRELFIFENGPEDEEEIADLVGTDKHNTVGDGQKGTVLSNQSLSSEKWRNDALEYLDRFIDLIENSGYGDRIIGYHLGYGLCGETHMWGNVRTMDFGLNEKKRFFEYGMKKYKTKEALEEKWGVSEIDERNVPIPKERERYFKTNSLAEFFHDGEKYTSYTDYNLYRQYIASETIEHFAKFVKEKTGKVVGFFHGYVLASGADRHGHTDLEYVLNSPYIDFICAPKSYYRNSLGEPGGYYAPPLSVNRKKLWFDEMDYPHEKGKTDEFIKILWREFAKDMSMGTPFWWMDLLGGWYDCEKVQKTVAELIEIKKNMPKERESIAEVLLVTDENSAMFTVPDGVFQAKTMQEAQAQVALAGIPYDMYRMRDLCDMDLGRYKVIYFMNCFKISADEKEAIYKKIGKDTVLIFNYAYGAVDDRFSLENVEKNTGFKIREISADTSIPYFEIVDGTPIYSFADIEKSEKIDDLCAFSDIPTVDAVAVARHERADGGTNILAAVPALKSDFLRETAKNAGCEIYPENTVIYADSRFLGVFAHDKVKQTMELDGKYYDVKKKEYVSGKIDLDMKKGDFVFLIRCK